MNKAVSVISYIGTLGVGLCVGALSTRAYFAKRESERADREIESVKETMRKTYKKEEKEDEPEKVVAEEKHDDIPSYREYHTFSTPVDILDKRAELEHPREEEEKKPYFIDIDDFDSVTLGYAKKELQYYMDDGTLVDESENTNDEGEVVSIVDTVGVTNLESFENSLESCCYIRNEQLKEDYEISKIFGSYRELLGDD